LEERRSLLGHRDSIDHIAFTSETTLLSLSYSVDSASENTIRLWDTENNEQLGALENITEKNISGVAFAFDTINQVIAVDTCDAFTFSGGFDNPQIVCVETGFLLIDIQSGNVILDASNTLNGQVTSLIFSPDSSLLVTSTLGQMVSFFMTDSSSPRNAFVLEYMVFSMAYSPDGQRLALADTNNKIHLIDIDGNELALLEGHTNIVTSVNFSPDNALLVSGSLDGSIRVWNVETYEELTVLSVNDSIEIRSVAFSSDGTLIASAGNDGMVRLWGLVDAIGTTEATSDIPQADEATSDTAPNEPHITPLPTIENAQIEIVQVLNPGDISTEAIELRNLTDGIISLQGWTLRDSSENIYEFPDLRLFNSATISIATRIGTDFPSQLFWNRNEPVWEIGDIVRLMDADGNLQATLTVGD
jgi:WD40 repeat protein